MTQAVLKYSAVRETPQDIQSMLARIMTNSHALVTPTLDPLGICLDPVTALLNHSCVPNAHIVFDGVNLYLRSLRQIATNEEITISYIDTTNQTSSRQDELSSRYFFTCQCSACQNRLTNGQPEMAMSAATQQLANDAIALQLQAAALPSMDAKGKLEEAISRLKGENFPPHHQPYASLLHSLFLCALGAQDWAHALKVALVTRRCIEPVQYPLPWHPIRVVKSWVLLRLLVHIATLAAESEEALGDLRGLDVNYILLSRGLWKRVNDDVAKSHGGHSRLAREVKSFGGEIGAEGSKADDEGLELEWAKIEKMAETLR